MSSKVSAGRKSPSGWVDRGRLCEVGIRPVWCSSRGSRTSNGVGGGRLVWGGGDGAEGMGDGDGDGDGD